MDFQTAVRTCLNNYVGFNGRARRSEFWYFVLFYFAVIIVASIGDALLFEPIEQLSARFIKPFAHREIRRDWRRASVPRVLVKQTLRWIVRRVGQEGGASHAQGPAGEGGRAADRERGRRARSDREDGG